MEAAAAVSARLAALGPVVAPRVVPRQFASTSDVVGALACTPAGRAAVSRAVRRERSSSSSAGAESAALRCVLLSSLDVAAGVYRVTGARFVSEEVAQLMDLEAMLRAVVPAGPDCDAKTGARAARLFAQLNGHGTSSPALLQECVTLACSLRIVASAMPLKGFLLDAALPLAPLDGDAAADAKRCDELVTQLLKRGSARSGGGGGGGRRARGGAGDGAEKHRRKKKRRTQQSS